MTDVLPAPPPDLVPLSTVPETRWVGLTVWHPICQVGEVAYWRPDDVPVALRVPSDEGDARWWYDVGVVTEVEADHEWGRPEVSFRTASGVLRYGAYALWVRGPS